jgi:hypothetical protein
MLELETHKAAHEGLKIEVPEKTHQEDTVRCTKKHELKGHASEFLTQIQGSPYKKR